MTSIILFILGYPFSFSVQYIIINTITWKTNWTHWYGIKRNNKKNSVTLFTSYPTINTTPYFIFPTTEKNWRETRENNKQVNIGRREHNQSSEHHTHTLTHYYVRPRAKLKGFPPSSNRTSLVSRDFDGKENTQIWSKERNKRRQAEGRTENGRR